MHPITIRSLGAVLPPVPNTDDGIISGNTNIPAAAAAECLTKSLLVDFFDIAD
jgi:hypothetical protein